MVREKYGVRLTAEQAGPIGASGSGWQEHCPGGYAGPHPAQARPGLACTQVAQALDVVDGTVYRIKRRFAEDGMDGALKDRPQDHRYRKLDDRGEAHLIALGLQPGAGRPRPLDPAAAGWQGGGNWGWRHRCPMRQCGCT